MGRDVGVCLVGTGGIAAAHMAALEAIGNHERQWVVSRRSEAAAGFAEEWGFQHHTTDLDEALSDPAVDVVIVTSPNQVHAEQASRALEAGKHTIVEIPVTLALAEAEALAARSYELGLRLLVCHTMRSFSALREVRNRILAGEFHVTQVNGFFAIPRRFNQGWKGERSWIDNLLWHHGCHQVDATLWALGENARHVVCHFGQVHPQFGMNIDVAITFVTDAQQVVNHSLTYNSGELAWELRFIGNEDVLIFRNNALFDESGQIIVPEFSIRDLVAQDSQMLQTITDGAPSDYDIESVLPAMRVLDAAQRSADAFS